MKGSRRFRIAKVAREVGLMAIRMPNLTGTHCKGLIVCGDVQTQDSRLLKWMKKQDDLLVRYRTRQGTCYIHAAFGGGERGKTFHLDIFAKDFFLRGKAPPSSDRISDIVDAGSHLEGHRVDAQIEGFFVMREADLPPIIWSMMVETKADNVAVKAVGGTFFVSGAPIETIDWMLGKDDEVVIHLTASLSTTIDEGYLENALKLVDSAFETFVRGGRDNGRR